MLALEKVDSEGSVLAWGDPNKGGSFQLPGMALCLLRFRSQGIGALFLLISFKG